MPEYSKITEHTWVFGSSNPGKLKELQDAFAGSFVALCALPDPSVMNGIVESGSTIEENARIKAVEVAKRLNCHALADDTGLFVDALDGAPGVLTARYAGAGASVSDIRSKLLKELNEVPLEDRTASFRCALALADAKGNIILESKGICEGRILCETLGDSPFPYDPLFWIPDCGKTLCQLEQPVRNRYNHRTIAARNLLQQLGQEKGDIVD